MGIDTLKMKVVFFNRKPRALGNFSVESYFKQIRENLPPNIEAISLDMPYESNGLWKRLANAIFCIFNQGDVNHITGDIHYVGIFLSRKKTILTVLDCGMLHQISGFKHKILKWFWFTAPIKYAAHVTAISAATKEDILHFIPCNPDKISIVYVSIQDRFQPFPKSFNQQQPRILHVGTAPNKNLERLIPALKDIPCTLVIVGKVNDSLKALIQENNIQAECIERRLSDDEILDQYRHCDILSLVSTLEGFGMPIVEANAVGRVVITSNTTSMPEIAGDAAVLVNPFDTHAIREGFLKIIENSALRKKLIDNGLKNHLRFQPKQLAEQYAQIYQKLSG